MFSPSWGSGIVLGSSRASKCVGISPVSPLPPWSWQREGDKQSEWKQLQKETGQRWVTFMVSAGFAPVCAEVLFALPSHFLSLFSSLPLHFLLVLHSIYLFIFYLLHSSFKLKNNPWHIHDNHIGHTMQLTCALYPFPSACVIPVLVASILWWGLLCPSAVPKIAESGVASSTA